MTTTPGRLRGLSALVATLALGLAALVTTPAQAFVQGDATADPSWRVDGPVYATVVVGDTVVVGGNFDHAVSPSGRQVKRVNLAAFSLRTGSLKAGWHPRYAGTVRALVSDGATVWAGGSPASPSSHVTHVAKINLASGRVRSDFRMRANGPVYALAVDGKALYVGGSFTTVNDAIAPRIVKVSAAKGGIARAFRTKASDAVYGIAVSPVTSDVFLGGSFFQINGKDHHAVAAVDGTTGAVRSTNYKLTATTRGLDISPDGRLLYGATGGELNSAAAWDTHSGRRIFGVDVDGPVRVVRYHAGTLYAGFSQGAGNDTDLKLLAADAFNGTVDESFQPKIPGYWGVLAVAATDGGVVIGGDFSRVNAAKRRGMAMFRADLAPREEYVGGMTTWRYLDQGIRPDGWETPALDDSTWGFGLPQFGYGDKDEQTVVASGPSPSAYWWTTYYRTTFDLDAVPSSLSLALAADDGAVVYVNGVEAVRDNMPAGVIDNDTHALTWRGTSAENLLRTFSIDPGLLHVGSNIVAVELHQAVGGQVDAGFDARLIGVKAS